MSVLRATHPWITYSINQSDRPASFWLALGEAQSKCQHLAGVPLKPGLAEELHSVFLAKGIHATTAIEGNTLSEREVFQRIKAGSINSEDYNDREVLNILEAVTLVESKVLKDGASQITEEDIKELNRLVLKSVPTAEDAIPGKYRRHNVGVSDYRAIPHEFCPDEMNKLCDWLNSELFAPEGDNRIATGIVKAIVAHIYLVWIHPFGDGNGRTARLMEARFLLEAGVPSSAIHLLSDHYNRTRKDYFRYLSQISRNGGKLSPFLDYAAQGFVAELRKQIEVIKMEQWDIAWESYVYETAGDRKTDAQRRRIKVLLALSARPYNYFRFREIRNLTPEIAEAYAGMTAKAVARDISSLREDGFVDVRGRTARAMKEKLLAFLPRTTQEHLADQIRRDYAGRGGSLESGRQLSLLDLLDKD